MPGVFDTGGQASSHTKTFVQVTHRFDSMVILSDEPRLWGEDSEPAPTLVNQAGWAGMS
jgi:hypothetical protein